jgi:N-acetyl-anhydromuramyl-L-alanine amidase AmpD
LATSLTDFTVNSKIRYYYNYKEAAYSFGYSCYTEPLFSTFTDQVVAAYEFEYIPAYVGTNGDVGYDSITDNLNKDIPTESNPSIFWESGTSILSF